MSPENELSLEQQPGALLKGTLAIHLCAFDTLVPAWIGLTWQSAILEQAIPEVTKASGTVG